MKITSNFVKSVISKQIEWFMPDKPVIYLKVCVINGKYEDNNNPVDVSNLIIKEEQTFIFK